MNFLKNELYQRRSMKAEHLSPKIPRGKFRLPYWQCGPYRDNDTGRCPGFLEAPYHVTLLLPHAKKKQKKKEKRKLPPSAWHSSEPPSCDDKDDPCSRLAEKPLSKAVAHVIVRDAVEVCSRSDS